MARTTRSIPLLGALVLSACVQPPHNATPTQTQVLAAQPVSLVGAETTEQIFSGESMDPYVLALRATVWGYPLVRAAQLRVKATQPEHPFSQRPATLATAPLNRLGRARALADPKTRIGVAPNNDTLYVLAFLDTDEGPFLLRTPDFGARYYTFQFGEADSSTQYSYGQSTHGAKLPLIAVVAPKYMGPIPRGALVVRSRQRYMMIAGRILVNGEADLPAVHALQDRIELDRWLGPDRIEKAPVTAQRVLPGGLVADPEPFDFLSDLGAVLQDWRPVPQDAKIIAPLARIGLTRENGFLPSLLDEAERNAVERGVTDGFAVIRAKTANLGELSRGWSTSFAGSRFGGDYLLRAAVAMDQIYVNDKDEALYPVAHFDGDGAALDGRKDYVICFAKNQLPPVGAFWSITMYYAKGFLVPNSMQRYSIGDRTPGIRYGADGSLRIYVQSENPGPGREANWLPAPREGFMLMMRLYRPLPPAAKGQWHPPAIMPVEEVDPAACPAG